MNIVEVEISSLMNAEKQKQ